jgi:ankyrin repeat protein
MQQTDRDGNTPLHWAASGNIAHLRAILSDAGCDVNAKNKKGETPLHIACMRGIEENQAELLRNHANPNARDNGGNTPRDLEKRGG